MADETCQELDCCPEPILNFRVETSFVLLGEDPSATDPNIADGDTLLTEDSLEIKT
jgi:hypothetical protein